MMFDLDVEKGVALPAGTGSTIPWDTSDAPQMPVVKPSDKDHRTKVPDFLLPANACAARSVTKSEMLTHPKAKAAMQLEWDRLRAQGDHGVWDESKVMEWDEVKRGAIRDKKTVHLGRIFELCFEKHPELPESNKLRKFKGRVVFQGNEVKDQSWNAAVFQEISSCPATMEAAKAADCYGLIEGHIVMQADAEQAYTQALFKGTPTWVSVPRHRWPQSWIDAGYRNPVCPLVLALYGHADSGGYWEKHCEAHLKKVGFVPVDEAWHSCFWHPRYVLTGSGSSILMPSRINFHAL